MFSVNLGRHEIVCIAGDTEPEGLRVDQVRVVGHFKASWLWKRFVLGLERLEGYFLFVCLFVFQDRLTSKMCHYT